MQNVFESFRDDLHLYSEYDISLSQALLGGRISLRGLHKNLSLDVPTLFDQAQSLVAHGEGISRSDGSDRGHHFVRVGLRAPTKLSSEQRRIMLAFARLEEARVGTVDGLEEELDYAHKFMAGMVEPKKVKRTFNVKTKTSGGPEKGDAWIKQQGQAGERGRRKQQHGDKESSFWERFRQATNSDTQS